MQASRFSFINSSIFEADFAFFGADFLPFAFASGAASGFLARSGIEAKLRSKPALSQWKPGAVAVILSAPRRSLFDCLILALEVMSSVEPSARVATIFIWTGLPTSRICGAPSIDMLFTLEAGAGCGAGVFVSFFACAKIGLAAKTAARQARVGIIFLCINIFPLDKINAEFDLKFLKF